MTITFNPKSIEEVEAVTKMLVELNNNLTPTDPKYIKKLYMQANLHISDEDLNFPIFDK